MRLGYDLIILDLELNHPGVDQETIIEIGAVKFLRDGGIHPETFSTLINHGGHLQPEIVHLTGITDEEIQDKGGLFPEAMRSFQEWATRETKNVLLAAWGGDVSCLIQHCKKCNYSFPFRRKSIEIKSVMTVFNAFLEKKVFSDGLMSIMNAWGVKWDGRYGAKHRARADAFNTAKLLVALWDFKKEVNEHLKKDLGRLGIK